MKKFIIRNNASSIVGEGVILRSGKVVVEWLHSSSLVVFDKLDAVVSPDTHSGELSVEF